MAEKAIMFFKYNKFVVQPEKASSKASNMWNILNTGGVKIGSVGYEPEKWYLRLLRFFKITASYGSRIAICDSNGDPIASITKPFSFDLFKARIKDVDGPLGTIEEVKQGYEGRRYVFYNTEGKELGSLEGDWRTNRLQMKDPRTASLGKIYRVDDDLNKAIFDEKSNYYIVELYIDPKNQRWRKMLLCGAAAIDLLVR